MRIKYTSTIDFSMGSGVLPGWFPPLSKTPCYQYLACTVNLPEVNGVTFGCQVTHVLYGA